MDSAHYGQKLALPKLLLFVSAALYGLDQLTKWLALHFIKPDQILIVIPNIFFLVQVHNTGASFGMLPGNNLFFIIFSIIALVALAVLVRRGAFRDRIKAIGAAFLATGILGNVTSRLVDGYVTDFLLIDLHIRFVNSWPAFNVADVCIVLAASLFIASTFQFAEKGPI